MQDNIKEISIKFHPDMTQEEIENLLSIIQEMIYKHFNNEVLEIN